MTWEEFKNLLDVGALAVLGAWFIELLPAIATLLTCIWWGIRIWETPTVQRLRARRKSQSR
jgi:hypothetical protein